MNEKIWKSVANTGYGATSKGVSDLGRLFAAETIAAYKKGMRVGALFGGLITAAGIGYALYRKDESAKDKPVVEVVSEEEDS